MKVVIQQVFPSEDFGGDYYGIKVLINDELVAEYGDWYHDKGDVMADGFIEGYCHAKGIENVPVKYEDIADPNCE